MWKGCAPSPRSHRDAIAMMKAPLLAALLCLFSAAPHAAARVWTNDEGQTIEADLVRVKGRTAILSKSGRDEISAPIARLSPADQAWIESYKELTTTRDWGDPDEITKRGQFLDVTDTSVRLKQGTNTTAVPFEELTAQGWLLVHAAHTLFDKEPPETFMATRPAELRIRPGGIDPITAEPRSWTDAKGRDIQAVYLGTSGTDALLFMRGKEFNVPFSKLSDTDRRWIAEQNVANLGDSVQNAAAAFSQIAARASQKSGRMPRELFPPAPAPAAPEPAAVAVAEPAAPQPAPEPVAVVAGPTINHINRLSDAEQRTALTDAFGDLTVLEESYVGAATCDHCKGYFIFPETFGVGDPCPYCTTKVNSVASLKAYRSNTGGGGGAAPSGGAPWYSSGLMRAFVAIAVVAVLGVVTKVAMSGGGDDDEDDED